MDENKRKKLFLEIEISRNYFLSYSIDSSHKERKEMLNIISRQLLICALRGVICYVLKYLVFLVKKKGLSLYFLAVNIFSPEVPPFHPLTFLLGGFHFLQRGSDSDCRMDTGSMHMHEKML